MGQRKTPKIYEVLRIRSGARDWHRYLYFIQIDVLNGSVKFPLYKRKIVKKTFFLNILSYVLKYFFYLVFFYPISIVINFAPNKAILIYSF